MTEMRRLLDLLESTALVPLDDGPLHGSLDSRALAKLLPRVDDPSRFASAMAKVRRGKVSTLNLREKAQLAMAFVSLLQDDRDDTLKAMRRLASVHTD